jgi:hypothetical protein
MSGEFHSPPADFKQGEPDTRYALIGAGFGLLLIFLGRRIPFRILGWPIIAFGVLFVVVMTGYTIAVFWKTVSIRLRPLSAKVRRHIRTDPRLGTLTRDVKARAWVAAVDRGDRRVDVVIDGDEEPDPTLVALARDVVANFDRLERRVSDYLAREAANDDTEDGAFAAEIRALRVKTLMLRTTNRPGHVAVDFEGPDEMRFWYCEYVNGELSGLDYD